MRPSVNSTTFGASFVPAGYSLGVLRLASRHVRSGLAIPSEPRKPTGPSLRGGYAVRPHHRYYDPIRPARRLPSTSRLRTGYRTGLCFAAAAERFPALDRRPFHTCRHPYAERRLGCTCPRLPQVRRPSPTMERVGSAACPALVSAGYPDDAAVFASCYGPRGCTPPCTSPTWGNAPAVEGFYARASPRIGHPTHESSMTTRHHRADTAAGPSPAGTSSLQAATIAGVHSLGPRGGALGRRSRVALPIAGVHQAGRAFSEAPRCRGSFHPWARAAATWRPPSESRRARPRPGARGAHIPAVLHRA
jgi:hypothetical protein